MSTEYVIYGDYGERGTESRKRAWTELYWPGLVALHCRVTGTPHVIHIPWELRCADPKGNGTFEIEIENRGTSHRVRLGATKRHAGCRCHHIIVHCATRLCTPQDCGRITRTEKALGHWDKHRNKVHGTKKRREGQDNTEQDQSPAKYNIPSLPPIAKRRICKEKRKENIKSKDSHFRLDVIH